MVALAEMRFRELLAHLAFILAVLLVIGWLTGGPLLTTEAAIALPLVGLLFAAGSLLARTSRARRFARRLPRISEHPSAPWINRLAVLAAAASLPLTWLTDVDTWWASVAGLVWALTLGPPAADGEEPGRVAAEDA